MQSTLVVRPPAFIQIAIAPLPFVIHKAATDIEAIQQALAERPGAYLLALAGIPGSGKSTFGRLLCEQLPGALVLPMDGYHLPKAKLTAAELPRRGARHTFDSESLRADLTRLKSSRAGEFPSFDHAEQDPRPNAIRVAPETRLVIVEGLYLLMREWQLEPLFDLKIFLDCELATALDRVAARHLSCGLAKTMAAAQARAQQNDRLNALEILNDGCRERADLVIVN